MNRPFQLSSVDHITLVVSELDQSREFYCDHLGLQVVPRPDFDFPGLWLVSGTTQIHLTESNQLSGSAGWSRRDADRISRGHHFAFEVEDAHAACSYLQQKGVQIVSGPKNRPDGPIQIYFYDPDGHLIELFAITS